MNHNRTASEEKNLERDRAKRTLKKLKKMEKELPMLCAKVNGITVCAVSEKELNETIKQLKNR